MPSGFFFTAKRCTQAGIVLESFFPVIPAFFISERKEDTNFILHTNSMAKTNTKEHQT